jgi:hypothetical protein
MINVAALRPSEFLKLDEKLSHPGYAAEFGEGLVEYLNEVTVDGGADSDRVYVMARQLTDAKVWNHIDVNALAELLMRAPAEAVAVFMQALPANLTSAIGFRLTLDKEVRALAAKAQEEAKVVVNQTVIPVKGHWAKRTLHAGAYRVMTYPDPKLRTGKARILAWIDNTGEVVEIEPVERSPAFPKKKSRSAWTSRSR